MAGPWEEYQQTQSAPPAAGPWTEYQQPRPGLLERAGRWLTGADREAAIPGPMGVGIVPPQQARRLTALFATTQDPKRLQEGIRNIEPDVQFQKDDYGNDVALWPRKNERGEVTGYMRFYPNPAGLDVGDVMRTAGVLTAATGVGKAAQLLGLPVAGALGGAVVGGTEAGLTELASSQASGQPYQFSDIPFGAVGGAVGDKLVRSVAALANLARARGPSSVVDAAGNLLPQYEAMMRAAGVDPAQVSAGLAAEIAGLVRRGARPSEAAVSAMSRGLPVRVPMSRGQISGSKGEQLFEDMAASGGLGMLAEGVMMAQRQRQQQALTSNLDQLLERLAPGAVPTTRGAGGEAAQAELAAQREAAKQVADDLYTAARQQTTVLDPNAALDVADAMRAAFRQSYSPRTAATAAGMLDDFDNVAATGDLRQMMDWRAQMTSLRKGAPTVDAAAAADVLAVFDDKIDNAVRSALLYGDVDAAEKWAKAISNYAEFSSLWKSKGGILNLLTERVTRDGERVLRLPKEQVADVIFTATASGLAGKTGLARDLVTLQRQLNPAEWNMLRQEAFLRLMDTARGAMRSGETQVSGVNFKKALDNLTTRNPGVMNALFTKAERDLFSQFATVAARATGGAVNASNSANAAAGLLQRIGSMLGNTNLYQFLVRVPVARGFSEAVGGARAVSAAKGGFPARPTASTLAGAGLGGVAASSEPTQTDTENLARGLLGLPR